jgi:lysophospholipid acyltransferase (LPLAT)-like uncharacterized protein
MKLSDWFFFKVLPTLAWTAMNLLRITLRIQIMGNDKVRELMKHRKPLIFTFWHGRQFLMVRYLSNKNISAMSSTSRDGRLQAKILKKFHYEIIPGSSSKTPVRALIQSLQKIQEGFNFAITVDGPTGPIYKVKPGALYVAKKTGATIIPMSFSSAPAFKIKSWDRYLMPKPFSRVVHLIGEPWQPSQDLDNQTMERETQYLEIILNRLTQKADRMVHLQ